MKFNNRKYIDTEIGKVYLDMLYKYSERIFYEQEYICKYLNDRRRRLLTLEEVDKIRNSLLQIEELKKYKSKEGSLYTNSVPIVICNDGYSLVFLYDQQASRDIAHHNRLLFPIIYKDL